jgi:sugar phosphate isomerase/epimerase
MTTTNRRDFLKNITALAAASAAAAQAAPADWKKQIGLEMYTVRDLTPKDYEGTLAKIAAIGYKEIEPASADYGGMQPKDFRAMLDRHGISMPSTHIGATAGPNLEKELEGFQIMGLKYTEVRGGGDTPGSMAKNAQEAAKRTAKLLNEHGKITKKFGMKMLYHNHAQEFQPFMGSAERPYDILLAETDPSLVAMQLDIGWASVAGQNVLEMFQKNPGRFELWHVKDAYGIKTLDPKLDQRARMRNVMLVPIGQGEVKYKPIFAAAELAGMKHFCIEQDNAAAWGDSVAAARISFEALTKVLS